MNIHDMLIYALVTCCVVQLCSSVRSGAEGSGRAKAMMAHVAGLSATKQPASHTQPAIINLADSPIRVVSASGHLTAVNGAIPATKQPASHTKPAIINLADSPIRVPHKTAVNGAIPGEQCVRTRSPVTCQPASSTESYNYVAECEPAHCMANTNSDSVRNHKETSDMDGTDESSMLSPIGQWDVHPWSHMTFRDQAPDIDYSTCDRLSSAHEWQAGDTMHFTTLQWLISEAHPGIPDVMHNSTHTPFEAAGWVALQGRSSCVWSKPVVSALQKLWSDDRWAHAMRPAVSFNEFATDILDDKCYILQELYHAVYIQGTIPWSNWWHLSAPTPLCVYGSAGMVMQEATHNVRLHPLVGTHGGIFNSGDDGTVVQVPDNVGRPYRIIPTDFDMIGLCMATEPKGTHFVTAGIINIVRASTSVQECSFYAGAYKNITQKKHPTFKVLILDSLDKTSPPGLQNCLLQTCGLVSANGNLTRRDHISGAYYMSPSSVPMRQMREVYVTHLHTPKQINTNTCALHAACNLQRLVCACRAQTDLMKVGKQVRWYPHTDSWITKCVEQQERAQERTIVGSYPVEVVCTILWLRGVVKQKLLELPNGTSSVLYKRICDSISRMINGAPVPLDSLIYKDISARVKVYKSSLCTQFDNESDKHYDETNKYCL
jgi:hypothetical protein